MPPPSLDYGDDGSPRMRISSRKLLSLIFATVLFKSLTTLQFMFRCFHLKSLRSSVQGVEDYISDVLHSILEQNGYQFGTEHALCASKHYQYKEGTMDEMTTRTSTQSYARSDFEAIAFGRVSSRSQQRYSYEEVLPHTSSGDNLASRTDGKDPRH